MRRTPPPAAEHQAGDGVQNGRSEAGGTAWGQAAYAELRVQVSSGDNHKATAATGSPRALRQHSDVIGVVFSEDSMKLKQATWVEQEHVQGGHCHEPRGE